MMKRIIGTVIQGALKKKGLRLVRHVDENERCLQAQKVPGWFSKSESMRLYSLGLLTNGPILEIGHFLGKTTACLCEAIHDSNKDRAFVSYDLGFRSAEEFKGFYDEIHKEDVPVPSLFTDLVYSTKATTTDLARENLENIGLAKYVNLISGNFINLDQGRYDLIFCDAMHEPNEIGINLPHIVERSARYCVWAFHDMNRENMALVLRSSDSRFVELVDSLGVFLYVGCSRSSE